MSARLDRRRFLQLGAGALLAAPFTGEGTRAPRPAGGAVGGPPHREVRSAHGSAGARVGVTDGKCNHLVCVYLQGGVDGLALLPPLRDRAYSQLRARTAVPADRALALDADVGLHPAFAPLAPLIARGQLRGLTGVGAFGAGTSGSHARANARLHAELRRMAVRWELAAPVHSALPTIAPPSLRAQLAIVAAAIAAREPLAAVLLPVPGFDTHVAQARRLEHAFAQLATDLAGFVTALGPRFADTSVLVISEQGRGLHENRMAGTDDGDAGAALLLGGRLPVGGASGPWPDLAELAAIDARGMPVQLELAELLVSLDRELFGAERPEVPRG